MDPAALADFDGLQPLDPRGSARRFRGHHRPSNRDGELWLFPLGAPNPIAELRLRRFTQAARRLPRLQHPNLRSVITTGETPYGAWVFLAPTDGESFPRILESHDPLDWETALALGLQLGDALGALASAEVIHGDLTPDALTLRPDGVVVLDGFGPAGLGQVGPTPTVLPLIERLALGLVPLHAFDGFAPEQARGGPASVKSDVYALGALLLRVLTGRTPHGGRDLLRRLDLALTPPELQRLLPDHLPSEFELLLHELLAPDPDDRPLAQDLPERFTQVARAHQLDGDGWSRRALAPLCEGLSAAEPSPDERNAVVVGLRGKERNLKLLLRPGDTLTFGRSTGVDVTLPFGWISRRHAQLHHGSEGIILHELGSANGTAVNGRRVHETVRLHTEDQVAFGKSKFEVSLLPASHDSAWISRCAVCACSATGRPADCAQCPHRDMDLRRQAEAAARAALQRQHVEVEAGVTRGVFERFHGRFDGTDVLASVIATGAHLTPVLVAGSQLALELSHPAVLETLRVFDSGDHLVVLQPWSPGDPLPELLRRRGPLPGKTTAQIGGALADALVYTFSWGVPHLAVQPSNVWLAPDGRVQLLGAGLSPELAELGRSWVDDQGVVGCYTAPELACLRETTPASAVYALGATLAFALTGDPLSEWRSGKRLEHLPLTMVAGVAPPLAELLTRATSPRPQERPGSLEAFRDALHEVEDRLRAHGTRAEEDLLDEDEMTRSLDHDDLPPELSNDL